MLGYRYDTETGLYYLQSRYYNPEWGKFINADGIVATPGELQTANMFVYCKNNPVNMSDENGDRPEFSGTGRDTGDDLAASLATMNHCSNKNTGIKKVKLKSTGKPNSVGREYDNKGNLTKERWYGEDGRAVRDKHYTDHGNSKEHPKVPHEHDWGFDENGNWTPGPWYSSSETSIILAGTTYLLYKMIKCTTRNLWWVPANL